MALGLFLRVSWICFLFGGSAASPAIKGYGYPHISDSRNIGDDGEDEVLTSPTYDQSYWQASYNQPTRHVYTSYNKPAVVEQPAWALSQNLPNTPSSSEEERLVNGVPRDWGVENLDEPLTFPLPSNPAKPQPGPDPTSLGVSSANSMPASPSTGDWTYASPTDYYAPPAASQDTESLSFESWQPEPDTSGYGVVDSNAEDGGNTPHVVYEDVFQYPSEISEPSESYGTISNTAEGDGQANDKSKGSSTEYAPTQEEPSFPSYPTDTRTHPANPSGMERFPEVNFDQSYQPHDDKISWHPQKPVNIQKVEVSQRVSEPVFPPAPPPSYITQSRNGYQRNRYRLSRLKYSPELPPPMPVSSKGAKSPAPSQPATPKGAKDPQRAKW